MAPSSDELGHRVDADRRQHLRQVGLARAEVPRLEAVERRERSRRGERAAAAVASGGGGGEPAGRAAEQRAGQHGASRDSVCGTRNIFTPRLLRRSAALARGDLASPPHQKGCSLGAVGRAARADAEQVSRDPGRPRRNLTCPCDPPRRREGCSVAARSSQPSSPVHARRLLHASSSSSSSAREKYNTQKWPRVNARSSYSSSSRPRRAASRHVRRPPQRKEVLAAAANAALLPARRRRKRRREQ